MAPWQLLPTRRSRVTGSLCCLAEGMLLSLMVAVQLGAAAYGTHVYNNEGLLSVSGGSDGSGSLQSGTSGVAIAAGRADGFQDDAKSTTAKGTTAAATVHIQAGSVASATVETILAGLEADESAMASAEEATTSGRGGDGMGTGFEGQSHQPQLLHARGSGDEGGEEGGEGGGRGGLERRRLGERAADAAAAAAAAAQAEQPKEAAKDGTAEARAAEPEPAWARKEEGLPPVVVPPLEQFKFDIALSTGYRPQYGATIASCLVGLLASGAMLHASALHLLLSDARLLNFSLIHNLAHMGGAVRVSLYDMQGASTSMRARNVFYQLLRTPDLVPGPIPALGSEAVADAAAAAARLGAGGTTAAGEEQPGDGKKRSLLAAAAEAAAMQGTLDVGGSGGGSDLPSVFLEDDVWMVDDFPRKMHTVAAHASRRTGGGPFVIKLYSNTGRYAAPAVIRQRHAKECNATATVFPPVANAAATAGTPADVGAVLLTPYAMQGASLQGYRAKPRSYRWGAQGLYFSDGALRRRLLACYLQYTGRKWERQNRYKDWPLKMCLGAMHVASFDSGRSLVQHIGASSSLFGDANTNAKYHRACSFPFVERLPSEDLPADWY